MADFGRQRPSQTGGGNTLQQRVVRLFVRPAEFEALPQAETARTCWIDWRTGRLTPYDGVIRHDHPVVLAALQRRQSATSLVKLLRDPLGYLWQYAFRWEQPSETEDPLLLISSAKNALRLRPAEIASTPMPM